MLAINTYLANPSPFLTPATQLALRAAHEAAYATLPDEHPPSLLEYLAPDVPVGPHLGNPIGFRPTLGEWLTLWNEDGSPDPHRMNQILALGGLALVLPQAPILQQALVAQPAPAAPLDPPALPAQLSEMCYDTIIYSRLNQLFF